MEEAKIAITERLRADGRWEEAAKFKDSEVRRLRGEGVPAKKARQTAWEEMARKYPPADTNEAQVQHGLAEVNAEQITALADAPVDYLGDVVWVYRHMANPLVSLDDAPSMSAWGLLQYARKNKQRYYEVLLPPAIAGHTKAKGGNESAKDEAPEDTAQTNELSKFLAAVGSDATP